MHPGDGLGIQQPRGSYGKATGDQGNLPLLPRPATNPPAGSAGLACWPVPRPVAVAAGRIFGPSGAGLDLDGPAFFLNGTARFCP